MWLINTSSLRLEHIVSPESRHYAILSHTWDEGQEVTFQDMANLNAQRRKKGFKKIKRTCRIARSRGLKYAWIDTCCINKENNTELAEAINSMFAWYVLSDSFPCATHEPQRLILRVAGTKSPLSALPSSRTYVHGMEISRED